MVVESAVVATQVMDANTTTTILGNLNTLYSNAVNQLITYTLGLVALVGVVIPTIISLVQQRSLQNEKKNLEQIILDEVDRAKCNMRQDLFAEIGKMNAAQEERLSSNLKDKFKVLEEQIQRTEAGVFFVQSNMQLENGKYGLAAEGYCDAIVGAFSANDDFNGQRALKRFVEGCLPNVNKKQFEDLELEAKFNELIEYLVENDKNGRHADSVARIKKEIKLIRTREAK